jgi:hypothetical protein
MDIFCIPDFIRELERLRKKNSYRDIDELLIKEFFGDIPITIKSGDINLNQSQIMPYIKRRVMGRGGYRIYFLLLVKNDIIYLAFIHPKTGTFGSENIKTAARTQFPKIILEAIKSKKNLFRVTVDENKAQLVFSPAT